MNTKTILLVGALASASFFAGKAQEAFTATAVAQVATSNPITLTPEQGECLDKLSIDLLGEDSLPGSLNFDRGRVPENPEAVEPVLVERWIGRATGYVKKGVDDLPKGEASTVYPVP